MFIDYFLRIALIVVLSMTMVNTSRANTYTVLMSGVQVAAADCDGFVNAYDHVFPTPEAVLSAFAATFPRTCYKSGVLHYTQNANNFVLTSNTSLTFDVLAIPANEYQGGTPAVYGILKTWTENISAECPAAGTPFSSGVYDLGTQPLFPSGFLAPCANGCALSFNGGIDKTAVIEGVTHYYASGNYYHDGRAYSDPPSSSCPAGTGAATSMAGAPSASCAPGQNYGTVNGKLVCLNSDGSVSGTDSAEALADAAAAEAARLQDIADKARQAAEAAAAAAGGTAEEIAAAGNTAAATAAGAAAADESVDDSPLGKFCEDNPDAPICIETDFGEVDDVDIENKTIDVAITPVAVSGDGSCPAPSPLVIRGQTYWFEWTTYCNFASGIKPILLAFAWLSAAGIMVGGFRT